jgi:cytochrome c oxidase cbb3-type subunit III
VSASASAPAPAPGPESAAGTASSAAPDNEPLLLQHDYDGIREYDNPLPGWWKGIFLVSIVWAIAYWIWFHGGGPGKSDHEEYREALAIHDRQRAAISAREQAMVDEGFLTSLTRDSAAMARGKEVFQTNCISCHTDNGRGLVGPNLTDEFQIHGHARLDIYATVRDGVVTKGMISWGPILKGDDLARVAAFVSTLRGKNVPGGKAPEGERVGPFPDGPLVPQP